MRFRLWHVFALMGLILLAGVLSVQQLEAHVGRTTVPGIVLVDAPELDAAAADGLARRWPGAMLQWTAADATPLSPFGATAVRALRSRGSAGALLMPRASAADPATLAAPAGSAAPATPTALAMPADPATPADASLHEAWGVIVTDLRADRAADALADCLRGFDGVRPFLLGLVLPAPTTAEILAAVGRLVNAADTLPSFRRTSVLVLGARDPQSQRRLVVRIDRGDVGRRPQPGLADLLAGTR